MPLENPNLRRGPDIPVGPKQEMSEATWSRVRLQMLSIRKAYLSMTELAEETGLDEETVRRWLGR
ncbi:MAG: hypothetical protein KJN60_13000 [Boseongicola sp.]|nr:hypothetical protein [Boseongicola sp.]